MATTFFEGTASISTTEYSLPNASTVLTPRTEIGRLDSWIDFGAMAAGDVYEWKVYEKPRSGGTQRLLMVGRLVGVQGSPILIHNLLVARGWDVTVTKISGTDRTIEWGLRLEYNQPLGEVVADAGNTATTFKTNLTETAADHWKDALLVFTNGSLAGQVKKVTAFNPTTDFITMTSAFTAAPAAGDDFILIVV